MVALAEAFVAVRPDTRNFGRELQGGLRKVDTDSAGRAAGTRFQKGFHVSAAKALGRGLAGAGVVAGGLFAAALTKGFGRLSAIEDAEAKLTGLGHSAKSVETIMGNALASVKGTAFGLDEAATVAATAVASGIKPGQDLRRTLGLVADAATIGGASLSEMGGIFADVAASNKIQGDTINQLNERGIPILQLLGDVLGKSQGEVAALASKGKIDFATFQKAMERGLGGAALASGNTASGAFKNMGAAFARVGAALLKDVFPRIGEGIGGITGWLDEITPVAERIGRSWGEALQSEAFHTAVADLKGAVAGLTGNEDLVESLEDMAGALPKVVTGLADAITKYTEFSNAVDKFENKSFGEGDKVGGPVGQIVKDFGAGGTIEQALIQFREFAARHVSQAWADMNASFAQRSAEAVDGVERFVSQVGAWFVTLKDRVVAWVRRMWADAKASFVRNHSQILAGVGRWVGEIVRWATDLRARMVASVARMWGDVRSRWTNAQTTVRNSWSTFWGGVKTTGANAIDSVRTKISNVLDRIRTAFSNAKTNIGRVWAGVKSVVSSPIEWIRNNVYNKPLVPVWNKVAKLVNGPTLDTYATGGVIPGYTPGRDNRLIGVGGGEAIMRPEWTRVAGTDYVNAANKAARTGGTRGVGEFLAHEGLPGFADGGVVGWIRSKIAGAGDLISGLTGRMKDWVLGGLRKAAGALLNPLKDLIERNMPNSGVGNTVGSLGKRAIDLILNKIGSTEDAALASMAAPTLSPGGLAGGAAGAGSRRIVSWHGGRFTERFRNTLINAQKLAGRYLPVTQGGWRPRTSYSGTSHAGDAIDTAWSTALLSGLRKAGVAAWHRSPSQGPWNHHVHGVPLPGYGYGGGSAIWQAQDYLRGGNGLALGGIVKGGRGGITTRIGEGRNDELVMPLPPNRRASGMQAAPARQPIRITLIQDGIQQMVEGLIEENGEYQAGLARSGWTR